VKEVKVMNLEQYSQEYKRLNPNGKVPALLNGEFSLFESHAMMIYIH